MNKNNTRVLIKRLLLPLILIALAISQTALAGYAERPNPDGPPTLVYVRMFIADIDNIDTANQKFTANVYYEVYWNDDRLAHDGKRAVTMSLNDIWHPNLQFVNRQRLWKTFPERAEVKPNGDVLYRQRVWGDFSEPLKLHRFPFDEQTFKVIALATGADANDILIKQYDKLPSAVE